MRKYAVQVCDEIRSFGKIPRLIIIDDGGIITNRWYKLDLYKYNIELISIQQTISGIDREPNKGKLIKIDVARSAAKRFFDPAYLQGVLGKVRSLEIMKSGANVGIVGLGWVGSALARELLSAAYRVKFYDHVAEKNVRGAVRLDNALEVVEESDVIFGCTGQNALS